MEKMGCWCPFVPLSRVYGFFFMSFIQFLVFGIEKRIVLTNNKEGRFLLCNYKNIFFLEEETSGVRGHN